MPHACQHFSHLIYWEKSIGCPINTYIALNFCAEQELLCIYISKQIKKKWDHSTIFRAQAVTLSARLLNKGILLKIQSIFGDETVFTITFDCLLESVSLSPRIATFTLLVPYYLLYGDMAYGHIVQIWHYGHVCHIVIWQPIWPIWVSTEQAI